MSPPMIMAKKKSIQIWGIWLPPAFTILILCLAFSACSSTAATSSASAIPSQTQTLSGSSSLAGTYTSALYGISIDYPQGWTKSEESLKDSQDNSNYGARHNPVQFSAPEIGGLPACQVIITMYLNPPAMQQPFNQWSLAVINSAGDASIGSKLISSISATLAGNPAYEITWSQEKGPLSASSYQGIRIWAFIGTKIYDISGLVFAPANYSDYSPTILQMIDSFRIKS